MILGAVPYSRGKPQKTSAGRPSDEGAVRSVIASNGVPFLQMSLWDRTARQEGRRKEIMKGRGEEYIEGIIEMLLP